jgi:uncharacterized protein DUF397
MQSFGVRQAAQPAWRKASLCQSGECVEVAELNGMIVMRDSKDPSGHVLRYTAEEFRSLIRAIKAGEYDFAR